jgi:hypothetical protein
VFCRGAIVYKACTDRRFNKRISLVVSYPSNKDAIRSELVFDLDDPTEHHAAVQLSLPLTIDATELI